MTPDPLSPNRRSIYDAIAALGESTSAEVHKKRGLTPLQAASASRGRFTELREAGFITEGPKRLCAVTGKLVGTWRAVANPPSTFTLPTPTEVIAPNESLTMAAPQGVQLTPLGARIADSVTKEQNDDILTQAANGVRACLFTLGDASERGQRLYGQTIEEQADLCGVDGKMLAQCALVAVAVPIERRHERLKWEHHQAVARLPAEQQDDWLHTAEVEGLGVKRLKKSLNFGRVATEEETEPDPLDKPTPTLMNHVQTMLAYFRGLGDVEHMDDAGLFALHRDMMRISTIHADIRRKLLARPLTSAYKTLLAEDLALLNA